MAIIRGKVKEVSNAEIEVCVGEIVRLLLHFLFTEL